MFYFLLLFLLFFSSFGFFIFLLSFVQHGGRRGRLRAAAALFPSTSVPTDEKEGYVRKKVETVKPSSSTGNGRRRLFIES